MGKEKLSIYFGASIFCQDPYWPLSHSLSFNFHKTLVSRYSYSHFTDKEIEDQGLDYLPKVYLLIHLLSLSTNIFGEVVLGCGETKMGKVPALPSRGSQANEEERGKEQ